MTKTWWRQRMAPAPTKPTKNRPVGSSCSDVAIVGRSPNFSNGSSRQVPLRHQNRVLCLALSLLMGVLVVVFGSSPWANPLDNDVATSQQRQRSGSAGRRANNHIKRDVGTNIENDKIPKKTASCEKGCLTTHVLDTANGIPAAGMRLALYRIHESSGKEHIYRERNTKIGSYITNRDGRIDGGSLLTGSDYTEGTYELVFNVSGYFDEKMDIHVQEKSRDTRPFLSIVPIRFGISDATFHYHVPLLVSQYSYSTYRGS
mmetsp:Transcript_18151/g.30149  ORF Transcript_18151/g.30149 Transcript_18151/m.30149 type:complete len:259 (-) Transcript_18151:106-882(-)